METEGYNTQRRFELVLSAAQVTTWSPPNWCSTNTIRWSFGGNRLQIKAETRLLADVDSALRAVALVGSKTVGVCQALMTKQDLLQLLLENEQLRLVVWLYPLDHGRRHIFSSAHSGRLPSDVSIV